jgi:aspartyl/asparaginyl beta-hydroxylase (cupin superfamily)
MVAKSAAGNVSKALALLSPFPLSSPPFHWHLQLFGGGGRMTEIAAKHDAGSFKASSRGQTFATRGMPPLGQTSKVVRFLMAIVAGVERLNLRYSKVGNPSVYDSSTFPWAAKIEREWKTIRGELETVLTRKDDLPSFQDIATGVASITNDRGWKTFLLTAYGARSDHNIGLCPETWRIVKTIPGLKAAMFSIFEPGKHLPPHRGPYNGVLRFHLGLIVPQPQENVAIRVDNQICHWQEGRALIFDDAYEHEAWNRTDKVRVVLFVDFVKPLRFPANILNWMILNMAAFTPLVQEGHENHRQWERSFHDRA